MEGTYRSLRDPNTFDGKIDRQQQPQLLHMHSLGEIDVEKNKGNASA